MTLSPMLAALMGGGPIPMPSIPCAVCLAEWADAERCGGEPDPDRDPPENGATLVAGTLVCRLHAAELLATFDRGHIAAELASIGRQLDRACGELEDIRRASVQA